MKNLIFVTVAFFLAINASAQFLIKDVNTPNEYMIQVVDSIGDYSAEQIKEAIIIALPIVQSNNMMTRQMQNNNKVATILGDNSLSDMSGRNNTDNEPKILSNSINVKFIDGVKFTRFFYNLTFQVKDGRYRIKIKPIGVGGYVHQEPTLFWEEFWNKNTGELKNRWARERLLMFEKIELTMEEFKQEIEKALEEQNSDW